MRRLGMPQAETYEKKEKKGKPRRLPLGKFLPSAKALLYKGR